VLIQLRKSGWKHAIISNHVPELECILDYLGVSPYIDCCINSAKVGYEKPHPEIYRLALERMGNPSERWMVGDNHVCDVATPESLGIKSILVGTEHARVKRRSQSLSDVPGIILMDEGIPDGYTCRSAGKL